MTCLLSIVILASLITLSGCTKKETTPEPEIPTNYTTFTDAAGLFSISYPPDWETALSLIPDVEAAVKDILTAINSDLPVEQAHGIFIAGLPIGGGYYWPNVSIVVESVPGLVVTHNQMVEAETTGIKQLLSDYHQFSRVKTTVGGREATIIDWEGTFPEAEKSHNLDLFVLVGKTVWVVGCTQSIEEFSKWEEDFQAIVRSLRILK
jgi:hypothetical protein